MPDDEVVPAVVDEKRSTAARDQRLKEASKRQANLPLVGEGEVQLDDGSIVPIDNSQSIALMCSNGHMQPGPEEWVGGTCNVGADEQGEGACGAELGLAEG